MRLSGLEPPTYCSVGNRSIQLSYRRKILVMQMNVTYIKFTPRCPAGFSLFAVAGRYPHIKKNGEKTKTRGILPWIGGC